MQWLKNLFTGAPSAPPVHVDDSNFEDEVMRSQLPVVVDFWSPSCGPCMQLAPVIMKLTAAWEGKVKFVEINVAEAPRASARLRVRATPTVVYMRPRGREVERTTGFRGRAWHDEIIRTELIDAPSAD